MASQARTLAALAAAAVLFGGPAASLAVPITVPTDLTVGDQYRLLFVTSTTRDGTSTNIADYNAFVTAAANAVPGLVELGTTWTAIVSTDTVDARDNTKTASTSGASGVPIYSLDDRRLRDDDFLWPGDFAGAGPFPANICVDETGGENIPPDGDVWTGTQFVDGRADDRPMGNTNGVNTGNCQFPQFPGWVEDGILSTTDTAPFYAISGTLTVIPEPATAMLLTLGLVGLAAVRRRD